MITTIAVPQTQTKWFPQFKQGSTWMFSQPVKPQYGFDTIEECEGKISEMEQLSIDEKVDVPEFRIIEVAFANNNYSELVEFVKKIAKWELPSTGEFWDDDKTRPVSYETNYGSQGVRNYFITLAQELLNTLPKE